MPTYAKGHKRAPNKDFLQSLSARHHGHQLKALRALLSNPPSTWDSRTKNWIGPIKDQSQCGSCWDFSGTCVVEVAYYKAGVFPNDGSKALSEEYTLSCGHNGGCNGDDNTTVLQWAKQTGLPLSSDYGPYTASEGRCNFKTSMALYKVDDWGFANSSGDTGQSVTPVADIKLSIMTNGCVGAAIAADDSFMNVSAGQVFDKTTSDSIDHDIALVGWNDTATKTMVVMSLPGAPMLPHSVTASNGWWWLRNSWGTSWCEQGYCRIGWGINLVGTESVWAAVKNANPPIDWGQL